MGVPSFCDMRRGIRVKKRGKEKGKACCACCMYRSLAYDRGAVINDLFESNRTTQMAQQSLDEGAPICLRHAKYQICRGRHGFYSLWRIAFPANCANLSMNHPPPQFEVHQSAGCATIIGRHGDIHQVEHRWFPSRVPGTFWPTPVTCCFPPHPCSVACTQQSSCVSSASQHPFQHPTDMSRPCISAHHPEQLPAHIKGRGFGHDVMYMITTLLQVVCAVGASETAVFDTTGPQRIDGEGTTSLIEAATALGLDQFILISSLGTGKVSETAGLGACISSQPKDFQSKGLCLAREETHGAESA